jgi:(p)ppGpp synthase/HD superfamily hydrolase
VVGWLHDTVEDTVLTLAEIEAQFGSEASTSVDAINRREDEVWSDHLGRVAANPVAKVVKISDLIDNSNLG